MDEAEKFRIILVVLVVLVKLVILEVLENRNLNRYLFRIW
ncbi:hypothetical protein VPHD480_0404 [Vibrio phage D480]|nr:hypothetical protein MYOV011v1_p0233 [Vibrio phage 6E35.1a]